MNQRHVPVDEYGLPIDAQDLLPQTWGIVGTPPRTAIPISRLRAALADPARTEGILDLLTVILDEMGRAIAELDPVRLRDTVTPSGRFGWLKDGTPVIYL